MSCRLGDAALGLYGALQEEKLGSQILRDLTGSAPTQHPGRHMQSTYAKYVQIGQTLPGVPHLRVSLYWL